ncbi:MAG: ATP F0F1 synthase subunit C [Heliobacteriaceae bacterium]|jgi:F-type H+-transporting ATPase subunit c|nr:ATP F0F1 synthase subunit C [Heliobacteriaceae bacterium]
MTVEEIATQSVDIAKLGAGIAIGFGAIGGGIGLGIATKGVLDAISRQPAVKAEAFKNFLIGAGLAEATAIYALFIAMKLAGMF